MHTYNKSTLLLILFFVLIGCRSTDDDQPIHTSKIMKYTDMAPESGALYMQRSPVLMERGPVEKESNQSLPQKRMIIKTATITCEVSSYDETFSAIEKIVAKRNGFIVKSSINSMEGDKKSGSITLRIPSPVFEETLEEISRLSSKVLSKSIFGNDVTEEFYDVAMHLENKKKVESRYREILKSAKNVKEILQVEKALGNVREEIDGLEGRKRFLADQTALSTINVNLQEPQALVMVEGEGFWVKVANGFRHGLTGFADVLSFCISACISAVPAIILLLLVAIFTVWLTRYLKSRKFTAWKK
jgi:hypothetical protein